MFSINSLEGLQNIKEADRGYINEINIVGCDIKIFPEIIFEFFNLEMLNIISCGIEILSDKFEKLPNLQELELDYNPIKILPKSIIKCERLNYLSFQNTKIEILPKWLGKFDRLEHMSLTNCNIKSIEFDITKIYKVNISINSYSNINNLFPNCKYIQINYLNEPVTNLPLNLKKIKLFKPYKPINVKVPFGCELIIED